MAEDALASLMLDRFVSASSSTDAQTSLESILEALRNNKSPSINKPDGERVTKLSAERIWKDDEILGAFRHVLHTGQHKHHDVQVPVDEGASLVCKIYIEMVEQDSKCPLLDRDDSLLECLIDVISNESSKTEDDEGSGVSMYTRVLALQLLTQLCTNRPSKAQTQLLQAPNGLHRLGDLLSSSQEEILRNEALLLAQVIAEWPSCAKIWMFDEVADQVMILAIEEGGLTKGNLLVQDCLNLLFNLWKHDPNLADLVFQSPTIASNLPRLLDLRLGTEFMNPPKKRAPAANKDDDLDDILKSASANEPKDKVDDVIVPRLTTSEEEVIGKVLDILSLLLESDDLKKTVWTKQHGLCSLVWELALVAPPPPQVPFVCTVPSPSLQQKALEVTSLYFHDNATMERHAGLDRLLYLVCTGGLGSTLEEKMGISQASLHVIRQTITAETASQMLMDTLAPPMSIDDGNGEGGRPQVPPPTVVHKLLNTVAENLTENPEVNPDTRKIFLAGALGGLSIFLSDQTTREVMLRITTTRTKSGEPVSEEEVDDDDDITTTSLIESILQAISKFKERTNPENPFLSMTLLRFLCHWSVETPSVVHAILSSNQSSTVLSDLLSLKPKSDSRKKGVAVLGKLLLGIAMEFMGEDERKCGGWTRSSIMELIARKSGGISKFTLTLEQFKSVQEFGDTMPWSVCDLEFKEWTKWFSSCVLLVRKRVVRELTGGGEDDNEGEGDESILPEESGANGGGGSARSLQKVVHQQSKEIGELQAALQKANAKLTTQENELAAYRRRVESAPSELDTMLDEYTAKVSELEKKVSSLEEEGRIQEDKQKSLLEDRDTQLQSLQMELEETKTREKEARDETESIRGEIQSLSEAYTSLEQQFREQQIRNADGASPLKNSQQPGERQQEGSIQHPQNSGAGVGSTEMSTLRAENERLRNDAQAAEQWMTMAVEKMQTLNQQNTALQVELSQLRDSQSQGMNEQQRELQQQYQALFDEKQGLIQQQNQLQAQLSAAMQEKENLQQSFSELEGQLLSTTGELDSTKSALEALRSQAATDRSELESRLEAMMRASENASNEIIRLEGELIYQKELLNQCQNDNKAQSVAQTTSESALPSQRQEAENLKLIVEQQKAELEKLRGHDQQEIYKRESRIRELEDRLDRAAGGQGSLVEEMKAKDDEIAELSAANDSAQDWMQKAVGQFTMLQEQLFKLGSENATLIAEVRTLKEKVMQSESAVVRARVLEQESSLQASRLTETEASLAICESELKQLQEDLATKKLSSQANEVVAQQFREEIDALKTSLQGHVSAGEQLRAQLKAEEESKAVVIEELTLLKSKQEEEDSWTAENLQVQGLQKEILSLKENLREKESLSEQLKVEIEELKSELESMGESSKDMQKLSDVTADLERAKMENTQLLQTHEKDKTAIQKLVEEISVLRRSLDSDASTLQSLPQLGAAATTAEEFFGGSTAPIEAPTPARVSLTSPNHAQDFFSSGPALSSLSPSNVPEGFFACPSSPRGADVQIFPDDEPAGEIPPEAPPQSEDKAAQIELLEAQLKQSKEEVEYVREQIASSGAGDRGRLEELEATVRNLRQKLEEREQEVEMQKESIKLLEARNANLAHSLEIRSQDASRSLPSGSEGELRPHLPGTKASLADAFTKLENSDEVLAKWEERVVELESAVKELENQLEEQSKEAELAIEQWQKSYASLETKNQELLQSQEIPADVGDGGAVDRAETTVLQKELEQAKNALVEAEAKLLDDDHVIVKWEEQVAELESIVKDLRDQLREQEENAESVIAKWQESCNALEERNSELISALESSERSEAGANEEAMMVKLEETEKSLAEARESLGAEADAELEWQRRVSELELALKDSDEEAQNTISKWQESHTALEEKNAELLSSIETYKADLDEAQNAIAKWQESYTLIEGNNAELESSLETSTANLEKAQSAIANWQASHNALEEKNAELQRSLDTTNTDLRELQKELEATKKDLTDAKEIVHTDEDANILWQERVSDLETNLNDLEQQLQQQEQEASNAISKWEESYTALEEKQAGLVESLKSKEAASSEALSNLQSRLIKTQSDLDEAQAKLSDDRKARDGAHSRIAELETLIADLEQQLGKQESEASNVIAELQETVTALKRTKAELSEHLHQVTSQLESTEEEHCRLQTAASDAKSALLSSQELQLQAEARVHELEVAKSGLEKEHQSLRESTASLESRLRSSESALREETASLAAAEKAVQEWEQRSADLENTISDLENQLIEQEQEANNVISQWEARFAELQEENAEMKASLEDSFSHSKQLEMEKNSLESLEAQLIEKEGALIEAIKDSNENKEQAIQLETTVKTLQQDLLDNEKAANSIQKELQRRLAEHESKVNELMTQLEEAQALTTQLEEAQDRLAALQNSSVGENNSSEKLRALETSLTETRELLHAERANQAKTESALEESQDKVAELESRLQDVDQQMEDKKKEIADAIAEWQDHCASLENKNKELSSELDASKRSLANLANTSVANVAGMARAAFGVKSDGADQPDISELQATIESLEQQLDESETHAADVIADWQQSYDALQGENDKLKAKVMSLKDVRQGKLAVESISLDSNLETNVEELKSRVASLEAELNIRPTLATFEDLKTSCAAKEEELLSMSSRLEHLKGELDAAKPADYSNDMQSKEESFARLKTLEGQVQDLTEERENAIQAKASLEARVTELEQARAESLLVIQQWTEQTQQLEDAVREAEKQREEDSAEALEVIAVWESRCNELQASLDENQSDFEAHERKLSNIVKTELEVHERLLSTFDPDFEPETLEVDIDKNTLMAKLKERNVQLENLLVKQESDISALFTEMERLRASTEPGNSAANGQSDMSNEISMKSQIAALEAKIVGSAATISQLQESLSAREDRNEFKTQNIAELQTKITEHEVNIAQLQVSLARKEETIETLESKINNQGLFKIELEAKIVEQREKLNSALLAEQSHLHAGDVEVEKLKLQESLEAKQCEVTDLQEKISALEASEHEARVELGKANTSLEIMQHELTEFQKKFTALETSEQKSKKKLEKILAETNRLEALTSENASKQRDEEALKNEIASLRKNRKELEAEVERLVSRSAELEDEVSDANNNLQMYIVKEVSDNATELATDALRQQLLEFRRQCENDHAAYLAEKAAREAAEAEIERLRADLMAFVDITDQEVEIYGAEALTIKATDKIHRKERSQIAELQASLDRALAELQTSKAAERDAEERAAKAAHHVVVVEQELSAAKSEFSYFMQTMDETRQDEESKRASLEHRIRSLENDLSVSRRFHSSETDSLRNELTQVMMEKDRAVQLLKESEKNKTAMIFAASKDYSETTNDSPEIELAKLRIEKAQLLIAASEDGARAERRLREVMSKDASSTDTDLLVEKERRLAAETAYNNMKMLVSELQSEVQSYRENSFTAKSPSQAWVEKEHTRIKEETERITAENASLRSKLDAAEKARKDAHYKIDRLTADVRKAQADSHRLEREVKFQTELQGEMKRMQRPVALSDPAQSEEEPGETKSEDMLPNLVDQLQNQAAAIEKEREMYRSLHMEHEELLALLAETHAAKVLLEQQLGLAEAEQ